VVNIKSSNRYRFCSHWLIDTPKYRGGVWAVVATGRTGGAQMRKLQPGPTAAAQDGGSSRTDSGASDSGARLNGAAGRMAGPATKRGLFPFYKPFCLPELTPNAPPIDRVPLRIEPIVNHGDSRFGSVHDPCCVPGAEVPYEVHLDLDDGLVVATARLAIVGTPFFRSQVAEAVRVARSAIGTSKRHWGQVGVNIASISLSEVDDDITMPGQCRLSRGMTHRGDFLPLTHYVRLP
jgi:hypothetical protein